MKKFQKVLSCLLVLSMLLTLVAGITVSAAETTTTTAPTLVSGKCGANVAYTLNTATGEMVISGTGPMADYSKTNRPPWYDEYSLLIKRVLVTAGVTSIGNYAFNNLLNCTDYVLGSNIVTIGEWSFSHGTFHTIVLPNSVSSIQLFAFFNCSKLTSASFPLTAAIAYGNEDLTNANPLYQASQNQIYASGTSGSIKWEVYKNGTLMIMNPLTFNVSMPDYTMGNAPWYAHRSLINSVYISSKINNIGNYAFHGLSNVKTTSIGSDVATIGQYAYNSCSSLESVALPLSVKTIGDYAFYGCNGLRSASAEANYGGIAISTVGNGNKPLTDVLVYANSGNNVGGDCGNGVKWSYNSTSKILEIIGTGYMSDYSATNLPPWDSYKNDIVAIVVYNGVKSIGNYAFANMTNVSSVSIGTSVVSIGNNALQNCLKLTSVAIPASTVLVYDSAFAGCTGLATATYDGVQTSLVIHNNNEPLKRVLRYLGTAGGNTGGGTGGGTTTYADSGYISGTTIYWTYMPTTGTLTLFSSVGETMPDFTSPTATPWAHRLGQITNVTMMSGIKNISQNAFANMPMLNTVSFSTDTTVIGNYAFMGASSLKTINFPANITTIMPYAFYNCYPTAASTPNTQSQMLVYSSGNEALVSVLKYADSTPGGTTPGGSTPGGTTPGGTTQTIFTGSCGPAVNYTLDLVSGSLIISGYGPMTTFTNWSDAPWVPYASYIKSISITDGVTSVSDYAFYHCLYVTTLRMGNTMANIGKFAFTGCSLLSDAYVDVLKSYLLIQDMGNTYLERVLTYRSGAPVTPSLPGSSVSNTIPNTDGKLTWSYDANTQSLSIKGTGAIPDYDRAELTPWYSYAPVVKGISVYSDVSRIGNNAFGGMTKAVDVFVANTVKSIGTGAFQNCVDLKNVQLHAGIETISADAFRGCASLENINLPNTLRAIGNSAFRDCTSLKTVVIPEGITTISDYTFCNCTSLESVTLPEGLISIGYWAFYGCKALKFLDLPSTLVTIGEEAFYNCSSLTGVVIKSTSTLTVKLKAFSGCSSIVKAVWEYDLPACEPGNTELTDALVYRYASGQSTVDGISWSVDRANGVLTLSGYGPVTDKTAWERELPYIHTIVFANGITGIGSNLLTKDKNIQHIKMADSITSIGEAAFELCTNLKTVELSNNLTSMGSRVFYGCSGLESIDIPGTLTKIPDDAFTSCTSLKAVTLNEGLTSTGIHSFQNCTSLETIMIPSSVVTLGKGSFTGCSALKSVDLTNGTLKPLTTGIFDGCSALATAYFNGTEKEWATLVTNADTEIKNAKLVLGTKLIIHYQYMDGTTAAPSVTLTGSIGETIVVDSPNVPNFTPSAPSVEITLTGTGTQAITIKYIPNVYTLTIKYQDANGNTLAETKTQRIEFGKGMEITSPEITGYTPNQEKVSVLNMTSDRIVTVVYTVKQFDVTVKLRDENGNKLGDDVIVKGDYMTKVTIDAPAVEHYMPIQPTYQIQSIKADQELIITYKKAPYTLTIHYVDEDGYRVAKDAVVETYFGEKVSVDSPEVTGMSPNRATVVINSYAGETEVNVVYKLRDYRVTFQFVEVDSEGYKMIKDASVTAKYGASVDYPVPTIEGYTTEQTNIRVDSVVEDTIVQVVYTRAFYKLTINYVDVNGAILGTYTQDVQAGSAYEIQIPDLESYTSGGQVVKGTMGIADKTLEVTMQPKSSGDDTPVNPGPGTPGGEDEQNPSGGDQTPGGSDEQPKNKTGRTIAAVVLLLAVLAGGGAAFYFLYLKKKPIG